MSEINKNNESTWINVEIPKRIDVESYKGRPLIKSDSPIIGGVDYQPGLREAIVVDPNKYPDTYDEYMYLATEAASVDGTVRRNMVLEAVFDTVKDQMVYSKTNVEDILAQVADKRNDSEFIDGTKIDLSYFMEHHTGTSRHQALAVGVMLEKFKDGGYIRGNISIEHDQSGPDSETKDIHTWIRYTAHNNEVYVIDVTNNYLGTLADSISETKCNYLRPEERATAIRASLAKIALKK